MTKENAITPVEAQPLAQIDATPNQLIAMAVQGGVETDQLEKLMELQERWEANQARKAYLQAVSKFKDDPPTVIKDKTNTQFNSKYASIEAWLSAVTPPLSKLGLSARYDQTQEKGMITVTCYLTHELGHSESATMQGPPDTSGAKNALQQIKSTVTYLRIGTLESILGISSGLFSVNDDANGADPKPAPTIPEPNVKEAAFLDEVFAHLRDEDTPQGKKITKVGVKNFIFTSRGSYPTNIEIAPKAADYIRSKGIECVCEVI